MTLLEEVLLPRLAGVRKAPARSSAGIVAAWRAQCPVCGGHGLPLSLGLKDDGGVVGHCFAGGGHGLLEVLEVLDLEWQDILPARSLCLTPSVQSIRGNGGPTACAALMGAIDAVLDANARAIAAGDDLAERMVQDLRMAELRDTIRTMARRYAKAQGNRP
jgi:hypothetical protein